MKYVTETILLDVWTYMYYVRTDMKMHELELESV